MKDKKGETTLSMKTALAQKRAKISLFLASSFLDKTISN